MGKVLLLLVVVALFFLVRAMLRAPAARRQGGESGREPERMVNCKRCGLYVPVSEAVEDHGDYYCSEQHRRLAR
ncbi:MAG: PP0621 family protein [Pseudomonadota bacterium]|nr:MAG: hypothetical protein DIU74_01770 [Pseudomonadota bacterium]